MTAWGIQAVVTFKEVLVSLPWETVQTRPAHIGQTTQDEEIHKMDHFLSKL